MQGKLIVVAYTLRIHIETSSLWAEFVNKKLTNVVKSAKQQQAYRTMRKRSTIDTAHAHRACFPSPMHTFM